MPFNNITAESANALIQLNKDLIIVDVRTSEEFDEGHIKNARLFDISDTTFEQNIDRLDKSKHYLVYCRSGNRSLEAMKIMADLNFENVDNLAGGIIEWKDEGFELIK